MQADRLKLVLLHRGEGNVARGRHADLRAVGGVDGEASDAVDDGGLDVSELLHADQGEILRRHLAQFLGNVHDPLLSPPIALLRFPDGVLISMARTTPSVARRRKSTFKSPLSSAAPSTSMPSASTKQRWNWRAAMPRWR